MSGLKEQITQTIETLPEPFLLEIALFLDNLRYQDTTPLTQTTPYTPITLGGLWEGINLTDEEIDEVREEMWSNFGKRSL